MERDHAAWKELWNFFQNPAISQLILPSARYGKMAVAAGADKIPPKLS